MKSVLPFRGDDTLMYSITYDLSTPESRELGSFEESGYIVEPTEGELQDILLEANRDYGIYKPVGIGSFTNTTADHDHDYFTKGHEKYYTLFINKTDGSRLNQEELDFITALLNEGKYSYDEESNRFYEWGGTPEYGIGGWIGGTLIGGFLGYQIGKAVGYGRAYRGYEGGGEITENEYDLVVNDWVYFTLNYPSGFQYDAFPKNTHLHNKFAGYYDKYGGYGALPRFWSELDGGNRLKLVEYIKANYVNDSSVLGKIKNVSDEDYSRIVTHWTMFGYNYPPQFVEKAFAHNNPKHFAEKFSSAYRIAGSGGAVNKFYVELSRGNQEVFADWVMKNYSGTKLEQGGSTTYQGGGEIKASDLSNWDKKLDAGEDVVVYDKNGVKYIYQGSSYEKDSVAVLKGFDESTYRMMPLDEIKSIEIGSIYQGGGEIKAGDFVKKKGSNIELKVVEVGNDWRSGKDYIKIHNDVTDSTKTLVDWSDYELVSTYQGGGDIPEGFHKMPDGTIMPDSAHYGLGGLLLAGGFGAYVGYKIGRAKPKKKGFETEKKIARKIKSKAKELTSKDKYEGGGNVVYFDDMSKEDILSQTVVYDNEGETYDRYTVFTPDGSVFGMSENARGFNQFVGDESEIEQGTHLGKKLKSVPKEIEYAVLERMTDDDSYEGGGGVEEVIKVYPKDNPRDTTSREYSWVNLGESNMDVAQKTGTTGRVVSGNNLIALKSQTPTKTDYHILVEYLPAINEIGLVRGKQNSEPSPKYKKYIDDLYNHLNISKSYAGGGGVEEVEEYNYLYLKPTSNGLVLELTDEGIQAYYDEEIYEMYDLFEDINSNSEWSYIDNAGDVGLGITDAPVITDGYYFDDDGEFTDEGVSDSRLYVWNDYMIKDLFDTLMEQGQVTLSEVKSKYYGGGETITKPRPTITPTETPTKPDKNNPYLPKVKPKPKADYLMNK